VEDFSLPPAPGTPFGKLKGIVTDQDTGEPIKARSLRSADTPRASAATWPA
jgi:hypothetical protein